VPQIPALVLPAAPRFAGPPRELLFRRDYTMPRRHPQQGAYAAARAKA